MAHQHHAIPALAVTVAAVIWGLWWIPLRALAESGLSGDWVSVVLYAIATLAMLPFAIRRRRQLRAAGLPLVLISVSLGGALVAWNHALIDGQVVRVVLLFYLCPIWATGFARVMLGERVLPVRWLSIAMGLTGAAAVLGFQAGVPLPRGDSEWLALGAGVLFALALTVTRRGDALGGLETTFGSFLAGALLAPILIVAVPIGATPGLAEVLRLVPFAVGTTVLLLLPMTWLLVWGSEQLDPGRVTLLLLLEIVVAAASATLLTDEPFGWRELIGCILILGAGLVESYELMRTPLAAPEAES